MDSQIRYVSREEIHKMIDEIPDEKFMILTYNKDKGISDNGKIIRKNKTKTLIDKATILVLTDSKLIKKVDLEGKFGIFQLNNENIMKTILLPKLEWTTIIGLGF